MTPYPSRKPRDEELDSFGITHIGKIRTDNQDSFLMATIYKHMEIRATSLGGWPTPSPHHLARYEHELVLLPMPCRL